MGITDAIMDYLHDHGIKQTFLAERCGWSRQRTNRILHKGDNLGVAEYAAICDALGLPYDLFYNQAGKTSA